MDKPGLSKRFKPNARSPKRIEMRALLEMSAKLRESYQLTKTCSMCKTVLLRPVKLGCGHGYCDFCLSAWKQLYTMCPLCPSEENLAQYVENRERSILNNPSIHEDINTRERIESEEPKLSGELQQKECANETIQSSSVTSNSTQIFVVNKDPYVISSDEESNN